MDTMGVLQYPQRSSRSLLGGDGLMARKRSHKRQLDADCPFELNGYHSVPDWNDSQ